MHSSNPKTACRMCAGRPRFRLSEATVGQFLRDTAAALSRPAGRGVSRAAHSVDMEGVRRRSRHVGGGLLDTRHREGRPRRHLVAEPRRMVADPVRDRAHRRCAGQYQSRLSARGTRIRAEQGRLQGDHRRRALQDVDVPGDAAGARARTGHAGARRTSRRKAARFALRDPHVRHGNARHADVLRGDRAGARRRSTSRSSTPSARRCRATSRSISSSPAARPAIRRARR